ncbi:PREDICTED: E3 [Prunus dulcis]|uniref:PREDICTED: E3 n=1 Tax=Prunus dulcis TaxID=3755 RepID=A0A5E4FNT2_PRUDU|nr:protein goliath-like [Prunus dulcis]VVA29125.1 PREDICTED: E3 [Prunus dulcis]
MGSKPSSSFLTSGGDSDSVTALELSERLHGGLVNERGPRSFCSSRLHANGTCSCETSLMAEISSIHATVLRIIMLTEALNEILDEIRHVPLSLSQSMLSLPAPENVVNSFPLKNHKSQITESKAQDAQECYICLSEYNEGDKIRVLPCCHEFHMECVDKWLKEKQGVCPLCRGDVCKGIAESSD